MQCEKCGLEMFSRPVFMDGERVPSFECRNKQCERYAAGEVKEIIVNTADTVAEDMQEETTVTGGE